MFSLKSRCSAWLPSIILATCLGSCASYKHNIMFSPTDGFTPAVVQKDAAEAEKNYVIQIHDYLELEVYSNKGERLIDPNGELLRDQANMQNQNGTDKPSYLVTVGGTVKFPMIDTVRLVGLTIRQAERVLEKEYDAFYKECFTILKFNNKRVVVLGSVGGEVIPLVNENVTLTEVLALAGGIGNDGKAGNIRLIRGKDVYVLDLGTTDGVRLGNMIVQPGDVVYVEPLRRPFVEGFRDYAPIVSMIISMTTLVILLFVQLGNQQ
jgi:polysaccharide export outer membrane protein